MRHRKGDYADFLLRDAWLRRARVISVSTRSCVLAVLAPSTRHPFRAMVAAVQCCHVGVTVAAASAAIPFALCVPTEACLVRQGAHTSMRQSTEPRR